MWRKVRGPNGVRCEYGSGLNGPKCGAAREYVYMARWCVPTHLHSMCLPLQLSLFNKNKKIKKKQPTQQPPVIKYAEVLLLVHRSCRDARPTPRAPFIIIFLCPAGGYPIQPAECVARQRWRRRDGSRAAIYWRLSAGWMHSAVAGCVCVCVFRKCVCVRQEASQQRSSYICTLPPLYYTSSRCFNQKSISCKLV